MRRRREKNILKRKNLRPREIRLGIREETPIEHRKTKWERTRDHPIFWLAGVLSAFLAIAFPTADALREPEISHSTAQTDDPFAVRFSLRNPSFIFPMTAMRINCVLIRIKLENNLSLVEIPIDDGVVANIQPGGTIEYVCPVHKAFDDTEFIFNAKIKINTIFRTLGHERTTESELFNWDIVSRQWIKGEIVN